MNFFEKKSKQNFVLMKKRGSEGREEGGRGRGVKKWSMEGMRSFLKKLKDDDNKSNAIYFGHTVFFI